MLKQTVTPIRHSMLARFKVQAVELRFFPSPPFSPILTYEETESKRNKVTCGLSSEFSSRNKLKPSFWDHPSLGPELLQFIRNTAFHLFLN